MTAASELSSRAALAAEVAAVHAPDVDEFARFPAEAVRELRSQGLLSAWIPPSKGGTGDELTDLVATVRTLGSSCSSTAAVFIDHQVQLSWLLWYDHPAVDSLIRRVASEGLLLGSAVLDPADGPDDHAGRVAVSGPVRSASSARYADALIVTLPGPASDPDQVRIALCQGFELSFSPSTALPFGYRGAAPERSHLQSDVDRECVLSVSRLSPTIKTRERLSHLLFMASWDGLASCLRETALAFLGTRAFNATAALRGSELTGSGLVLSALVEDGVRRWNEAVDAGRATSEIGVDPAARETAVALDTAAITAAETVIDIAMAAMTLIGMPGFANTGRFSVTRALRDALGAPALIDSPALRLTNAELLLAGST